MSDTQPRKRHRSEAKYEDVPVIEATYRVPAETLKRLTEAWVADNAPHPPLHEVLEVRMMDWDDDGVTVKVEYNG